MNKEQLAELTKKLKVTRGKGYFTLLKQILAECGQQIVDDAYAIATQNGRLTPFDVGVLAVKYDLNFKATCEWLEDSRVIPTGIYQRLMLRGLKAEQVLKEAREKRRNNES